MERNRGGQISRIDTILERVSQGMVADEVMKDIPENRKERRPQDIKRENRAAKQRAQEALRQQEEAQSRARIEAARKVDEEQRRREEQRTAYAKVLEARERRRQEVSTRLAEEAQRSKEEKREIGRISEARGQESVRRVITALTDITWVDRVEQTPLHGEDDINGIDAIAYLTLPLVERVNIQVKSSYSQKNKFRKKVRKEHGVSMEDTDYWLIAHNFSVINGATSNAYIREQFMGDVAQMEMYQEQLREETGSSPDIINPHADPPQMAR